MLFLLSSHVFYGAQGQAPILHVVKLLKLKERQVSAMQEDVLGTRRTAISETYVTCARCNKATRLRYARIIQSDVLSDSHSEFEYLCPECQQALADGEKDLPIV